MRNVWSGVSCAGITTGGYYLPWLPAGYEDRSLSHHGNCVVLAAPTHPVQQYSHSVNVSATFSPPLATLTHQDSRTRPEIPCRYWRMARITGSCTQILPAETAMADVLALPDPQQRFRIDLAALRTALRRQMLIVTYRVHIASLHIFSYFRRGSPGKILLKWKPLLVMTSWVPKGISLERNLPIAKHFKCHDAYVRHWSFVYNHYMMHNICVLGR